MVTKRKSTILLITGILLIAVNLRGHITVVPPLIKLIQDSLGLTSTEVGMLTTLPLLAFALISPLALILTKKYSLESILMTALLLLTMGVGVRSLGTTLNLYLGTCFVGCGIAIMNVSLPSLLKRDFPNKIPMLTSWYMLISGIGAGICSGLAIPITNLSVGNFSGWQLSLVSIIALPLITLLFWLPQMKSRKLLENDSSKSLTNNKVWQSVLSWQVTLYLGLNAFVTYIIISWLPEILIKFGYTQAKAGFIHGLLQFATAAPALFLLPIVGRMKDQSMIAFLVSSIAMIGITGLLIMPSLAVLWTILFGFGAGAGLILALSFIGLRTRNSQQTSALSAMSQSVGYLLAATGPTLVGILFKETNSWTEPLLLCIFSCALCSIFGWLAGRKLFIGDQ